METGQEEVGVEEEVTMVCSNGGEGQHLGLCYDIVATEVGQAEGLGQTLMRVRNSHAAQSSFRTAGRGRP